MLIIKILIAGGSGQVRKAFSKHFAGDHQVRSLTHGDLDITDAEAVRRIMFQHRPRLINNCAVLGVGACEANPAQAQSVNVEGAENLAQAAADIDAEFLHLSTKYVFDGKLAKGLLYTAEDAAHPINIYGQTKLADERVAIKAASRCFIVRTSWVFGAVKENFFSTAHRFLREEKKIRAFTDIWASATYACDLVLRVAQILRHGRCGIYHVANSGICSHYDFAREAARILKISASKQRCLIEPVTSDDLQRVAERPRYTPLRCKLSEEIGLTQLREWCAALAEYIRDDSHQNQ